MATTRRLTEEQRMASRKKRRRKRKIKQACRIALVLVISLLLIAVVAGGVVLIVKNSSAVYKNARVEAGVNVTLEDFLKKPNDTAHFTEDSDVIDTSVPGEYHLKIKVGKFTHKSTLIVEDTVAPVLSVKGCQTGLGQSCKPEDFVESASDATALTFSFGQEPNFAALGDQQVMICATDLGGNITTATATLSVWPIASVATMEAGTEVPSAEAFLLPNSAQLTGTSEISYVEEPHQMDEAQEDPINAHVGDYPAKVLYNGTEYEVVVRVVDTVAPKFSGQDVNGFNGVVREAEQFVASCEDMTDVTFSYETTPDFNMIGSQTVIIIGTDEGGNTASVSAVMTLMEDNEPPVISNVADQVIYLGSSISYKSLVTVTDNNPEGLVVEFDSSKVNVNEAGSYPVTCTATDAAGHTVSASFQITIKDVGYSIDEVNAMADKALATCITADMSDYDKAYAIFWYIRTHLGYYDHSDKSSWVKAAGDAFRQGQGDCYSYASMAKVMLDRAGITNMDIERIPEGDRMHYWNLVDIGDGHGWYHFDTTPRVSERPNIFLWDDATLKAYSDRNKNCHNYDRSKYPDIP